MNSEADYQKMTIAHLKEELAKRGITPDAKAKKSELIKLLQKAEEDAILNHSEDGAFGDPLSTPDEDLLNDDVLNDVLPEKLLDSSSDNSKAAEPAETEAKVAVAPTSEPEKAQTTSPPPATHDPLALDAKLKRAQRFGLPVGVTDPLAKAQRAKRFGVTAGATDKDTKVKRAERFGLDTSKTTVTPPVAAVTVAKSGSPQDEETKKKLISRAQRFGLPVNENGKALSFTHSKDKLAARAQRFGLTASTTINDSEMEAKKKARLERFGTK
ncbi:hypothetical protein OESDEN_19832 [Oesophagostomum dentatum]|uniref:HeH/LEM domain-containing protein n=1 Tax=Oesophagostomum dentatum TaxID=61180 RepID=A0A0B1SAC6_OESDE|nr:hypothetical protein OESDEN_19832 [Oesophagostomum dentatum]